MRAAVARQGVLVVDDVADPVPGPGEALVAVKACGICGSDLHALHYGTELVDTMREAGAPDRRSTRRATSSWATSSPPRCSSSGRRPKVRPCSRATSSRRCR